MIEVKHLRKTYGETLAVDDVSFDVHAGEIFGLLGPNGAGKTSTLECLEGLREPSDGTLRVAGFDPWKESSRLRNVIGVQLQTAGLPDNITPDEIVKIFCAYHKVAERSDLLERFGLSTKRTTPFHTLSTGQKRRLSLVLALVHEPQVLLLDEPTAGLDVASRSELHDLIREMQANKTAILLATHDMAEAEQLSDRLAILLNGKIVVTGTPMEITATGTELTKISVRTQNGSMHHLRNTCSTINHSITKDDYTYIFCQEIGDTVTAILTHIEAQDDTLIDLRVERPSLEERFLEITQPNVKNIGAIL